MLPSETSIAVGRELIATEDGLQEISHSTTRDSIITIRLSDLTPTSIHDEHLANEIAVQSPVEDSSGMVDIQLSRPEKYGSLDKEETAAEFELESPAESFPQMEDNIKHTAGDTVVVHQESDSLPPEEAELIQKLHRQSTMSMLSAVDEGCSDIASISIRSRSDSSGTFSSLGSATVDWLELEKKEEEAPRNETSDEVRLHDDD